MQIQSKKECEMLYIFKSTEWKISENFTELKMVTFITSSYIYHIKRREKNIQNYI